MKAVLLLFLLLVSGNFMLQRSPVIGIISSNEKEPNGSIIKVTYARFFESEGATVIPIPWDIDDERFYILLNSVNGIVLPGGAASLWDDPNDTSNVRTISDNQKRMQAAYEFALKKNEEGIHYPLYGICQGMESLGISITKDPYLLDNYLHKGKLDFVEFTPEAHQSRMFSMFEDWMFDYLENNKAMYFWHKMGMNTSVPELYADFEKNWKVTATSKDVKKKEFIAGVEHIKYPIFMHMFHPERIYYEAVFEKNQTHKAKAIEVAKSLAKMFVTEALKNTNAFEVPDLKIYLNIQNFETKVFGKSGTFYVVNKFSLDKGWDKVDGWIKSRRYLWVLIGAVLFLVYYFLSVPKKFREEISRGSESSILTSQNASLRKYI